MLQIVISHFFKDALINEICPSCKAPIVGTNPSVFPSCLVSASFFFSVAASLYIIIYLRLNTLTISILFFLLSFTIICFHGSIVVSLTCTLHFYCIFFHS